MKAITLIEPWCWAIAHAGKNIENRTWVTRYRGILVLHSGKAKLDPYGVQIIHDITGRPMGEIAKKANRLRGKVTAVCRLVNIEKPRRFAHSSLIKPLDETNPWAMKGQNHWCLIDVIPMPQPFPAKGAQGLWENREVFTEVKRQVETLAASEDEKTRQRALRMGTYMDRSLRR